MFLPLEKGDQEGFDLCRYSSRLKSPYPPFIQKGVGNINIMYHADAWILNFYNFAGGFRSFNIIPGNNNLEFYHAATR